MDDFTFRLAYGAFFAVLTCALIVLSVRGLDRKRYLRPVLYGFFFGFGCWFMFGMGIFTFLLGGFLTGYLFAREVGGWSKHLRAGVMTAVILNIALFIPGSYYLIQVPVTSQYPVQTINSTFTDNADHWDNIVTYENAAMSGWENCADIGGVLFAGKDNSGYVCWSQAITVPSGVNVSRATASFSYMILDNDGLGRLKLYVFLDNSTDNITLWSLDNTTHAKAVDNYSGWTSIENDVTAYVNSACTYKLWLVDNILGDATVTSPFITTLWDNASLVVTTVSTVVENYIYGIYTDKIADISDAFSKSEGYQVDDVEILKLSCLGMFLNTFFLVMIVGLGAALGGFVRKALKPPEPKSTSVAG